MDGAGVTSPGTRVRTALVVGFGNTLRKDDGLGPRTVEGLPGTSALRGDDVRSIVLPQLDVTLASELCEAEVVVFVDARVDDSDDLVRVERVKATEGPVNHHHTTHTVAVPELLRITRDWYGAAPTCFMVLPKGYDFSIGDDLSDGAERAATEARERIVEILRLFLAGGENVKSSLP